jgi:hypothetical protein
MWLPLVMQGVSKRALHCYSKCYCLASVRKTFTLKGVQTIHRSTPWRMNSSWFMFWSVRFVKFLLHSLRFIFVSSKIRTLGRKGALSEYRFSFLGLAETMWNNCEKTCPSTLCAPKIPYNLTRAQTWAASVGSQWLTAWAMARLSTQYKCSPMATWNYQIVLETSVSEPKLTALQRLALYIGPIRVHSIRRRRQNPASET